MIPEIHLRAFTDDQVVFDKVFLSNYYRIKNITDKTVLDLGAHVGFFTLLCVFNNAKKVYSVEPFLENFFNLLKNVEEFKDKVKPFNLGVLAESSGFFSIVQPEFKDKYLNFSDLEPASQSEDRYKDSSYFLDLDKIMSQIDGKLDFLKINLGYSELEMLEKSSKVKEVDYICGVTKEDNESITEFLLIMQEKGFKDSFLKDEENGETLFLLAKDKCSDFFDLYTK